MAEYIKEYRRSPDQEQLRDVEKVLGKKYRQFPVDIFLGMGIVAASLFGYFKSKRKEYEDSNPVTWKEIAQLGIFSGLVASLILILNQI